MESIDNVVFAYEDEPVARELLQKDIVRMQTPNALLKIGILAQQRPYLCFPMRVALRSVGRDAPARARSTRLNTMSRGVQPQNQ